MYIFTKNLGPHINILVSFVQINYTNYFPENISKHKIHWALDSLPAATPIASMVGASGVGSFTEAHTTPCMFFDSMASVSLNVKPKGDGILNRDLTEKKNLMKSKLVELKRSSFLDSCFTQRVSCGAYSRKRNKCRKLSIVDELGGQYEEGFDDVKNVRSLILKLPKCEEIINYLTYKAVRTVLNQLYEMNPPQYMWFHNFVADNVPNTGKRFLQTLAKEKLDLAERVMVTRLHLYGKWIKVCDHAEIYKEISDENLELMRERLLETIKWPADETDPDKMDS